MKSEKFNPSPAYLIFLSRLRLARMEANVSQRELARRLGIHHSKIVRSEAAQRAMGILEVRSWCQAIGLSVVEFTRELEVALNASDSTSPAGAMEDEDASEDEE